MSLTDYYAKKSYNGGIVFVSYLIAVVGAQTTLELLSRRTHIRGAYNWFLLTASAFTMGAVGVWSMHFVGNNSLTLVIRGETYQLSYSAGYTFGSLAVAIVCMFLAFAFVGVTEEARIIRIVPSGIFAGLGIVCMHYMGQFAIDYFIVTYRIGYLLGAIVIACVAVTLALYTFFKLREKWSNLWYKRLGCAMLMALAVCGMHYTALVGTDFSRPNRGSMIPIPKLQTPALIGIIAAVIVAACLALLYISIKAGIKNLPSYIKNNTNKRLILDAVIFDPIGRVLVKVDGTLPMTEIIHNLEFNDTKKEFSSSHPLFVRLFETSFRKASLRFEGSVGLERSSNVSATTTIEVYDAIESQFLEGCNSLCQELQLNNRVGLGILSDLVVSTNTISKSSSSLFTSKDKKHRNLFRNSSGIRIIKQDNNKHRSQQTVSDDDDYDDDLSSSSPSSHNKGKTYYTKKYKWASANTTKRSFPPDDEETVIESYSPSNNNNQRSSSGTTVVMMDGTHTEHRSSTSSETRSNYSTRHDDSVLVEDSDGEDKHIFCVSKLVQEKDVDHLLFQGFRFAEPVFIAKTMAAKLRIPTDHMRHYFGEMQQMVDSVCALTQHDWEPSTEAPAPNPTVFKACTRNTVQIGAFVLINETTELSDMHTVVEKSRQFRFPLIQLRYSNDDGHDSPMQLGTDEIEFLHRLQGRSLFDVAHRMSQLVQELQEKHPLQTVPTQFMRGLERSAQQLLDSTSYSKTLYQASKLHGAVLNLAPFSLTTGPCQLIVFKSFVNAHGAMAAVNHTTVESIKCVPLSIYRVLAAYLTDQAASIYQTSLQTFSPPAYLLQQQIYRLDNVTIDDPPKEDQVTEHQESKETSAFSLPPPPRAKRSRFRLATNALLNNMSTDVLLSTAATPLQSGKLACKKQFELRESPLTVLPTQDRFWWINSIVEETLHSSM
ncbi:MAG: hypothetical protein EXX96DRAFT_589771 [Benjaminiella poitrasii]|nr:MAG: hypothetical protein EXX96DRAFT_589771 [Benjaminiella poitrasii]